MKDRKLPVVSLCTQLFSELLSEENMTMSSWTIQSVYLENAKNMASRYSWILTKMSCVYECS